MNKRFTALLSHIDERLNLPQPAKSRIILEMASDMEDLYRAYLKKGLAEEEALRKTEKKFRIGDTSLAELVQIHQPFFSRWMDKLSAQARSRWEKIVLSLLLLVILALAGHKMLATPFFVQSSRWIIPAVAAAIAVLILSVIKFYRLYIKKDHSIKTLRRGVPAILYLSLASLLIGIHGYFFTLYASESHIVEFMTMALVTVRDNANDTPSARAMAAATSDWLVRTSALMIFTMLVSIFSAMIWFVLYRKILSIEEAECRHLFWKTGSAEGPAGSGETHK